MTLFGWDASDFDWARGPMDLDAARADGIDFFTHKATEGTSTKHVRYGQAMNRARAAGIPFLGAYIVIRSGNVAAQVDYFLSYLDGQTPWWRAMPEFFIQVDLEHWDYDQVSPGQGVAACELLRQRSGKRVVLYAPQWAYGNTIGGDDPLWASAYGGNPAVPYRQAYPGDGDGKRWQAYSGRTPVFLQYGSTTVIGRQGTCDANAFRGSLADLRQLITGSANPGRGPFAPPPDLRPKRNTMFRLIDPENTQFVVSPDTLSPTGWSHVQITPDHQGWALVAAGIGTANGSANDPGADSHSKGGGDRDWRPGMFGPSKADVRALLIADVVAGVLAKLPAGPGGSGATVEQVAAAVRAELDKTRFSG